MMIIRLLCLTTVLLFAANLRADPAPSITLTAADGTELALPREQTGVDVYFFWATWCPYCKALMPHLQSMVAEYGDEVTVLALQIRDDEDGVAYIAERGYDFIAIPDADAAMEPYGVRPTPALFLVDGAGEIHFDLYDLIARMSRDTGEMSHGERAGLRTPQWAAEIRQAIDDMLGAD